MLHNIFKIDQKSLSKLFITSQQTFTCSKSTREILEVDVVLMSLFLTLNIIHTIFESLLLTLNRKIFIWIASSNYENKSIYIDFFQTIKRCCQVHVQATSLFKIITIGMFQKEAIFCYFLGMLYEKQLGLLRGISDSPRCCWCVKSFLFSFCVYMIKADDTLTKIQFTQPGETVMRMLMHQFKLTKS